MIAQAEDNAAAQCEFVRVFLAFQFPWSVSQRIELHEWHAHCEQARAGIVGQTHPLDVGSISGFLRSDVVDKHAVDRRRVNSDIRARLPIPVIFERTPTVPGHAAKTGRHHRQHSYFRDFRQLCTPRDKGRCHDDVAVAIDIIEDAAG